MGTKDFPVGLFNSAMSVVCERTWVIPEVGSLRKGQGRCVEGRGPHKSHPAAEGHIPEKGDEVPVREPVWPHQAVFRRGRAFPLWTHRGAAAFATRPSAQTGRGLLLSLLAGFSAPGQSRTKNSTNNTGHRFRFQHTAHK